jgi:CMP-N-acetylneuraminic acid synthetase
MKVSKDSVWGIIPARGGSKSIPLKNMVELGGKPLISYVTNAARQSQSIQRLICSTEDSRIAGWCENNGVEVHPRPPALSQDDTNVVDVLIHLLEDIQEREGKVPEVIALLQATSPFLLPEHIDDCVAKLLANRRARSAQTVTDFPHNYHAFNQRVVQNGMVRFRFARQRRLAHNKQRKPKFYVFGNLLLIRSRALIQTHSAFPNPSLAHVIPWRYALDVDGPEDLEIAEWYLQDERVKLPAG